MRSLSVVVVGGLLTAVAFSQQPAPSPPKSLIRARLTPSSLRVLDEPDYSLWTIPSAKSSSITIGGVNFTLAAGGQSNLSGDSYKYDYTKFVSSLGERVISDGVTTSDQAGLPLTLTIRGLSVGNHTLLAWHNCWDKVDNVSSIDVAVDGKTVLEKVPQSIRVSNIWETATSYVTFQVAAIDQTVQVAYRPSTGNTSRVYLNGFEIDTPRAGNRVSFPTPLHRNEHVELKNTTSLTASWRPPKLAASVKYNVYLGSSPGSLTSLAIEQTGTSIVFPELNTTSTYYWRVDVVSGGQTYIGNTFTFRLAQLAFPGAEGWGRWARGGRGGKVFHVTTLEDNTNPGSLRHALTVATGPRTVVFDVGGVITTKSRLTINDKYITVAGQTAPGKGIVIQGWPLGLSGASDVIIRHLRVRPGKVSGQTIDGMGMQGSNHCIFDRCSMGWAMDESFSSRSAYNITFQRNFISEPLNIAGHKNYPAGTKHGYAATIGGDVGSFHHNLIAHAEGRSWSMGGGVDALGNFAGRLDLRNNVVYNFGSRVTDGGAHEVNFVGNYYKQGPASSLTYDLDAQYEDQLPGTQQYHCQGNSLYTKNGTAVFKQDSIQYPAGDGTRPNSKIACFAKVTIKPPPSYQKFFEKPFFESFIETQTSTEAYKRVLSDRGAQQPAFDSHDARIVRETLTGTSTYVGSASGELGIIDDPKDVGGLEDFPTVTRSPAWDADGDGIADWWDGSTGGPGYDPLDGYLNFMADPHVFVEPSKTVRIELAPLAAGFVPPVVFRIAGAEKGTVSVNGSTATYSAGRNVGIERLTVAFVDADGSSWLRPFGAAIFAGAGNVQ